MTTDDRNKLADWMDTEIQRALLAENWEPIPNMRRAAAYIRASVPAEAVVEYFAAEHDMKSGGGSLFAVRNIRAAALAELEKYLPQEPQA